MGSQRCCSTWTACSWTPSRSGSRPRPRSWPASARRGPRRTRSSCSAAPWSARSATCSPRPPGPRRPPTVARWMTDGMLEPRRRGPGHRSAQARRELLAEVAAAGHPVRPGHRLAAAVHRGGAREHGPQLPRDGHRRRRASDQAGPRALPARRQAPRRRPRPAAWPWRIRPTASPPPPRRAAGSSPSRLSVAIPQAPGRLVVPSLRDVSPRAPCVPWHKPDPGLAARRLTSDLNSMQFDPPDGPPAFRTPLEICHDGESREART